MKLLFITTYNVIIQKDHFFTRNVINGLIDSGIDLSFLTIHPCKSQKDTYLQKEIYNGIDYYHLYLSHSSKEERIKQIQDCFVLLKPLVIHSNMDNGLETEAAYPLGIPTILTIHIGGVICPRGGGNGFLHYDNSICPTTVSHKNCLLCCCQDLPGKDFNYYLLKLFPVKQRLKLFQWINKKPFIYYFTPLLMITHAIENSLNRIEVFKKTSTIIAANNHLKKLLEGNGIVNNVEIIPHGVRERKRFPFPPIENGIIKFYYLGRVQYSKGLHLVIEAMKELPRNRFEFHIIGDSENANREQRYYRKLQKKSKNLPIIFHGRLPNTEIETLIKNFHVMIHPTICLEVFGIAIAESLSVGRPVLATRCGGAEIQIKDGYNGWLINPNNIQELKDKLSFIIENTTKIETLASNTSIPKFNDYIFKLEKIYDNLISQ
ncbi:glycosyltransferase family 4 protein [Bacteroidales bacterium OttesenSCG-928-M11]|nr:glycosyltransferase family 4 protein [Bacteroidales bacterium OttesenSCG-928-M11]